jgi:hypothetical protein
MKDTHDCAHIGKTVFVIVVLMNIMEMPKNDNYPMENFAITGLQMNGQV